MKCRSVACIWAGTPPPHRVTAVTAFSQPPIFYTGGSDGSIIWWAFSDNNSNPEVKAVGMLCGHAAPITDLGICNPMEAENNTGRSSNLVVNSASSDFGAVISACSDGFLCVWSKSSGHCRCRRKLPPWVGSPCMIRTLTSRSRYVCIGCSFMDTVHVSDHYSVNSMEGSEGPMDRETQPRKPPKCTIVIVDTYSLTVTQTVFHGNLFIGPMKFMAVVSDDNDKERHSIFVVDSVGKQQMLSVSKDPHDRRESLESSESSVWTEGLSSVQQIISITTHGNIVAFILKDRCIFRLLSSDTKLGEISCVDTLLCSYGHPTQAHVTGGMFIVSDGAGGMLNAHENSCLIPENFAVWNNRGSAIVYKISYQNEIFQCEPHSEIPATYYKPDVRLSIFFLQVYHCLLRIESVCFQFEESSLWRPHVTIWSLHHFDNEPGKLYRQCRMLREGVSFIDCFESPTPLKGLNGLETESTSIVNSLNNYNVNKGQIVSSSMIISESLVTPYAVVYGYLSGLIELVRFDLFQGISFDGVSSKPEEKSASCKQYFSGHTGAVLCLAAHHMMGNAKGWSFNQVLVSGSMDCTVRIWDLDTGCLIMVMHHHVDPVRQIILPPSSTNRPWSDCFLSVGEDSCVALVSLETLRVERMFPGHMNYPSKVIWDGARGYIACLCQAHSGTSNATDQLYIWDVKTGCRERIVRGTAAHSMFDHFCNTISMNSISGTLLNGNTSVSSLRLPIVEDGRFSKSSSSLSEKLVTSSRSSPSILNVTELNASKSHPGKENKDKALSSFPSAHWSKKLPIKCSSPFPGIVALSFDLASLMFSNQKLESIINGGHEPVNNTLKQQGIQKQNPSHHSQETHEVQTDTEEGHDKIKLFEEYLLRFSLSFLHLWDVDTELDNLLTRDMELRRPKNFVVASGLQGDRGSLTLTFPGQSAILELWKSSSEFSAMRSLMMVSLAQRLISVSHAGSAASSSLAAFYTRNFMDKFPDMKPPSLQLLVAFWQAESKHVRMAARSLFHCTASHAIPLPLSNSNTNDPANMSSPAGSRGKEHGDTRAESISSEAEKQGISQTEESNIVAWLESFELQDWISCVGGTSQDAMTSHIIVAAALAVWYPSLVKPSLSTLVVHPLMKLAMAMNEKFSATAAELLAEGMETTWKECIGLEIPRLIGDIFFQIELSGSSTNLAAENLAVSVSIQESLVEILLPSLAMADIPGFLTVVESQIWSTASDSPVHLVSLMTLIRVMRGSPRNLAQYLDKVSKATHDTASSGTDLQVVNFILQTIDPSNSVMRKTCFQSSMTTLKEVIRVYPMVAMNDAWTRLAVGDVIGENNNPSIRVYDMQSITMIKVLDARGPPGLPSLLAATSETMLTTAISALSFSPDGEGLVAFSENGLMIRWWTLGSVWWEKLSRNFVPVQCTKLIFVPPWEGFSPNTSRSSIMASILGSDGQPSLQENAKDSGHGDSLKQLLHNLDLTYRLEWVGERKVLLTRHGHELGTFQL
ncbi:WD repeat-containing protein 7 [Senna tora]|uniref:WD repeat-containing protein 7 n=1 Tax=Senna tora TaxID=362788 RepID=A0A834TXU4_9FABA|nr:WD repeat-containing protein 7 [Senna tora]